MPPTFDPYYKWLAIPPAEQPPNHYRLLALNVFESDPDVIATAADQRMAHVRSFQGGKYLDASQRLLNELAAARLCLLKPPKKAAYDAALRAALAEQAARLAPPLPATANGLGPILDAPPLVRDAPADFAPLPAAPAPDAFPAYQARAADRTEPAPASFVAETDRPDAVEEIAANPTPAQVAAAEILAGHVSVAQATAASVAIAPGAAQSAAAWNADDPLGLGDSFGRSSKPMARVRRRKTGFPLIFFIGPLLGVVAVVAAVAYSNLRDAAQQADIDAPNRPTAAVRPIATSISGNSKHKPSSPASPAASKFGFTPENNPDGDTSFPSQPFEPASPPPETSANSASEKPSPADTPGAKPEAKKPTAARLPVPDAEAQRKALVEIKKVYKEEFAKATSFEGREALVKKLSDEATKTTDAPTMRYVMAMQALEEAVKICDVKMASGLVSGLCFHYDVDSWELKGKTLAQLAATAKTAEARAVIANLAYGLVDGALAEERYDAAVRLSSNAADLAAMLSDQALRKKTHEANARAHRMQQAASEVQAAQERLAQHPDDAAAHFLIGRFYCMDRGDWDSGLPHLVLGNDPELSAIARRDLAGAAQPADQVALADAWWNLADGKRDATDLSLAKGMRARAAFWYRRALGQLNGFEKSKAEKRIADATADAPAKP